MNFLNSSLGGLAVVLATCAMHAQSTHQQVGNFATNAGIVTEIQGVLRAPATAGVVPAEEYIAVFPRFEEVGYLPGGAGAPDQYVVESVDIVIEDEDDGNAGTGTQNQFTITFYAEDPAALVGQAVIPALATRQTVGPFIMPNTGTPGQAQGYFFNVALPIGGISIQRAVVDQARGVVDGSTFCGILVNNEADGNAITFPFLSGADLSAFGLAEFDLPNGSIDPRTNATAAGHGLTGALGGITSCAGGYVYLDDPTTAGVLDFFGPFSVFVAMLGPSPGFKVMVRTDQDGGVTANGNMPTSNTAPGSMTNYSSRRPVGGSEAFDCSNTSVRTDDIHFYYIDTVAPVGTPLAVFFTFGPPPAVAIDLDFLGWRGMACFPPNLTLTMRTGVTDANGEYFSTTPFPLVATLQRITATLTAIGVEVARDGTPKLSFGKCERVIL